LTESEKKLEEQIIISSFLDLISKRIENTIVEQENMMLLKQVFLKNVALKCNSEYV